MVSFCKKSNSYRLRTDNRLILYTRAREIILDALEKIGLEKSKFGVHSLRSGGATSAAAAGVCDRLFKKHGRWRSDRAKDGYVKENLSEKLSHKKSWHLARFLFFFIFELIKTALSERFTSYSRVCVYFINILCSFE